MLKEQVEQIINAIKPYSYGVRFSVILASTSIDRGQLLALLPELEKQKVIFRRVVKGTASYFLRR